MQLTLFAICPDRRCAEVVDSEFLMNINHGPMSDGTCITVMLKANHRAYDRARPINDSPIKEA